MFAPVLFSQSDLATLLALGASGHADARGQGLVAPGRGSACAAAVRAAAGTTRPVLRTSPRAVPLRAARGYLAAGYQLPGGPVARDCELLAHVKSGSLHTARSGHAA
jgi:hypothetical protein